MTPIAIIHKEQPHKNPAQLFQQVGRGQRSHIVGWHQPRKIRMLHIVTQLGRRGRNRNQRNLIQLEQFWIFVKRPDSILCESLPTIGVYRL